MNGKFLLFGRDETENSLIRFADRKISEQRRDERRFAEQRTTKHRVPGKKLVHCRRAQLSRCSTISGASHSPIRLESSNSQAQTYLFGIGWLKQLRNRSTQALANCETGQLVILHSRA